jgi:two-component system, OmpR family, response regulator
VAQKEAPDLVILDLQFPASDGITVLRRMRELPKLMATPVVVLTARDQTVDEKRARDAGATAFFVKPPDNHEFLAAIREALGETSNLPTSVKP